jgi:hypothetical protein
MAEAVAGAAAAGPAPDDADDATPRGDAEMKAPGVDAAATAAAATTTGSDNRCILSRTKGG